MPGTLPGAMPSTPAAMPGSLQASVPRTCAKVPTPTRTLQANPTMPTEPAGKVREEMKTAIRKSDLFKEPPGGIFIKFCSWMELMSH
ncbi:uncharacterized protein LOC128468568 isoform X3 [Spea bombifrons]|uniref:uncharacterized protein LOC128468568 isoform X3 n=1 Tax=Spea bombifrons TaxID=233779 RepID=UPI002349B63B|nr:uncharacterized protein LOC128468568 isoform X3 [Spea bombifrons]